MTKPATDEEIEFIAAKIAKDRRDGLFITTAEEDCEALIARIRQQDAEIERLQTALEPLGKLAEAYDCPGCDDDDFAYLSAYMPTVGHLRSARAALQGGSGRKFKRGDRVTKIKGSQWTGRVVGFYSTELTPIGYAVESETERGSVQIYPEAAMKGGEA